MALRNIYFELTEAFNSEGRIVLLASGQAVVFYQLAIMSKDGDWILREDRAACSRVLEVLEARGASYRAGAPLDPRWLAAGWSSHLEFRDDSDHRIRCDFFTRPPRVPLDRLAVLWRQKDQPAVIDLEGLIRMKQTQRAKDYPIIAELARRLAPELELQLTTDPDRIIELAQKVLVASERRSVQVARSGRPRIEVVMELAAELDELQRLDKERLETFATRGQTYLRAVGALEREDLRLPDGHQKLVDLAEMLLPKQV